MLRTLISAAGHGSSVLRLRKRHKTCLRRLPNFQGVYDYGNGYTLVVQLPTKAKLFAFSISTEQTKNAPASVNVLVEMGVIETPSESGTQGESTVRSHILTNEGFKLRS